MVKIIEAILLIDSKALSVQFLSAFESDDIENNGRCGLLAYVPVRGGYV